MSTTYKHKVNMVLQHANMTIIKSHTKVRPCEFYLLLLHLVDLAVVTTVQCYLLPHQSEVMNLYRSVAEIFCEYQSEQSKNSVISGNKMGPGDSFRMIIRYLGRMSIM